MRTNRLNYMGEYHIREDGNIVSNHSHIIKKHRINNKRKVKMVMISPVSDVTGLKDRNKIIQLNVTYLTAQSFLPNPNKYNDVKHIDGNVKNNHVNNLQWVPDFEQQAIIDGKEVRDIPNSYGYKITDNSEVFKIEKRYFYSDAGVRALLESYTKPIGQVLNKNGYMYVAILVKQNGEKYRKNHRVHRLTANIFIPNPENKPEVNHKDGNKLNNHVTNLEWNTHIENISHAIENGLTFRGEQINTNVLKESEVIEIIEKIINGGSTAEVAREYDVSNGTINGIKTKRNWGYIWDKHFPDDNVELRDVTVITDDMAKNIISDLLNNMPNSDIETKYGISGVTITKIKYKKIYKHVWDKCYPNKSINLRKTTSLDEETVKNIIQDLINGMGNINVAEKYGINKSTINNIAIKTRHKKVWDKYFPNN